METIKKGEFVLGTLGEIICVAEKATCETAIEKAFREIKKLENLFSYFSKNSLVRQLNNAQGKPISVGEEFFAVIKKAKEISKKTGGAFDITISPLLKTWGFYEKEKPIFSEPHSELIKEKLSLVGSEKIILDEEKKSIVLKDKNMAIDLGGIAKGYIVDRAVKVMRDEGIKNALVNLGGDIFCLGKGENKSFWRIGIQDPLNAGRIVGSLKLSDKAVATSGQYENFREIGGKKFGHIIDPRSGYPVETDVLSVSVVAEDCLTADALATAIFVLGKEKAEPILKEFRAQAVIITRTGKGRHLWVSSGLEFSD
ncbi:MAG: FAD:protein FMN transferase [Candidatus Omnitrophica bacterium]|nr:FAD:protein FMN transferase [Candidatus Omnitrophota bacterium]MCM8793198.1 FAD:protein FMN transferase [Candidatus Omnitrophota bacterium]